MLSINDLNIIIKYYAFNLPQRIQELSHMQTTTYLHLEKDEQEMQFLVIIDRFHGYVSGEEREVKLARKLVDRVLQVFQFFKNKSFNQNLLNIIQQRIKGQLQAIVKPSSVPLGQLFSYIHLIAKRGGMIRVPAEKRRISSRSLIKESLRMESKMTPTVRMYNRSTVNNTTKHIKSASLPCQKWKNEELIAGPFSCLDIQKTTFSKMREQNRSQITKDILRRNEKILNCVKKLEKKWKTAHINTEISEEGKDKTILSEMKSNSMKGSTWTVKKRKPVINRRRQGTMKENLSIFI